MRNIRCPHYSGCLDTAIELDLKEWDCSGCSHQREEGPIDVAEIEACILLLWAAYRRELWYRYMNKLYPKQFTKAIYLKRLKKKLKKEKKFKR